MVIAHVQFLEIEHGLQMVQRGYLVFCEIEFLETAHVFETGQGSQFVPSHLQYFDGVVALKVYAAGDLVVVQVESL